MKTPQFILSSKNLFELSITCQNLWSLQFADISPWQNLDHRSQSLRRPCWSCPRRFGWGRRWSWIGGGGEVIRKKLMPVMATILIDIFSGIASLAESYWGKVVKFDFPHFSIGNFRASFEKTSVQFTFLVGFLNAYWNVANKLSYFLILYFSFRRSSSTYLW